MRFQNDDTIVAVSTPPGENGIAIVRLSGPDALKIADAIFVSKEKAPPSDFKSHTMHLGNIVDNKAIVDQVILNVMRKPKTYTRQDTVEINCHGGIVVVKNILDLIVSKGARIAEPGEFTKRAFLNGRIDLAQAEAVLDIITSRTEEGLRVAQRQLNGETSKKIRAIRQELIEILAEQEADINFPDEELKAPQISAIKDSLSDVESQLLKLIEAADKGLILREGVTTVICGKPNVGKSSLMNSFLKQERVIVTPIPGTTRDAIEEVINIRGIPFKIVDTAGIIHADDELTKESVERSRHYLKIADLVLLVLDSSDRLNNHDLEIIDIVKDKKAIVVVNKTDLLQTLQIDEIKNHLRNNKIIKVSAKTKAGLKELEDAIYDMFWQGSIRTDNIFISNSRHIEAARGALGFLQQAIKGTEERRYTELIAVDIRDAVGALGLITGEVFTEELLDSIFSEFCIGK